VNRNTLIAIAVALLVPLLSYVVGKKYSYETVQMPRHYIYDSTLLKTVDGKQVADTLWHRVPDFRLANQLGDTVSWKDMEGNIVIADFFFTHCPNICPRLTLQMKKLQEGLGHIEQASERTQDSIRFLSISVDPERDSVPALKAWANRFQINPESWWLLTGPKKEIYDLSMNDLKMGLVDGQGVDTSFFHTDLMVLLDKNRNIRGYYHGLDSTALAQLAHDAVLLSLAKSPTTKKFYEGNLEVIAVAFLAAIFGFGLLLYFLRKEKKNVTELT
jgi:protein SCO1